jgi:hypothetical protein
LRKRAKCGGKKRNRCMGKKKRVRIYKVGRVFIKTCIYDPPAHSGHAGAKRQNNMGLDRIVLKQAEQDST